MTRERKSEPAAYAKIGAVSTPRLPSPATRAKLKATAIDAARIAGAVLEERQRKGFHVEYKDVVNLVTDADRQAERAIVQRIREDYPDHHVLAEEGGLSADSTSPYKWIIDPLDGTTNFAHGFPAYCVSIGVEFEGRCILGVVLDSTRDELFTGETGAGADMNGRPIRVSRAAALNAALLVTGFAYDIRESPDNNLDHFARFSLRAQGVRRTGAAALDLCYVASGRFDGYWELTLYPWDMAAGVVILQEADGMVTDLMGETFTIYGQGIVASNGLIHKEILDVLRQR